MLTTMLRTIVTVILAIIIALLVYAATIQNAYAITIYRDIPAGATTIANGNAIIGLRKVEIGRYWTWHGKARKYDYQPLYSTTASPVPEPNTITMLLAGIGMIVWRIRYRFRKK